jgi:Concanavalin A-like lectin/glucanases superfamily
LHHTRRGNTLGAAVGLLLSLSLSACGAAADGGSPTVGSTVGSTGASSPHPLAKALLLDFEAPVPTLRAGARIPSGLPNGPRGEVATAGQDPAPLRLVSGRDGGHAVAFPAPCAAAREKTCPKEIIEIYPATSLAPGPDDFEWGASVRLDKDQTAKGSNIIQKGFSLGGGSQWKLQVDGDQGHPSCVVVGLNDAEIHEVVSDVAVADGAWHDVVCKRSGDELVITVDGSQKKSTLIPQDLTIAPGGPVRIGGKDLKPDNDQYFGTVDDVFVAVQR